MKTSQVGGRRVEKTYRRLVAELASGKYPLNTPLPPGRELSVKYGVSHPTLRVAIRRLADEGRLEARHGAGVFVLSPRLPSGVSSKVVCFMTIADNAFSRDVQRFAINRSLILNSYVQHRAEWDSRDERKFLGFVKEMKPLALLAFCSPLKPTNESVLREIEANGTYVIHLEPFRADTPPEQSYLMPDYRRAGHMAAMKLMMKGHRKIRQLAHWERPNPMDLLVEQGVADALEEHAEGDVRDLRLGMMKEVESRPGDLRDLVSGLDEGVGLVALSCDYLSHLHAMAKQLGRKDLGLVAIHAYPEVKYPPYDCLVFDRLGMVQRILDSDFSEGISTLVLPRWARGRGAKKKEERR